MGSKTGPRIGHKDATNVADEIIKDLVKNSSLWHMNSTELTEMFNRFGGDEHKSDLAPLPLESTTGPAALP